MADDVVFQTAVATPPDGTVVAGDEIGGAIHQRVKVSLGADGTAVDAPGEGTFGMDVDVTRLPSLPAGTNNIGDVDVASLPALPAGNNNIGDVDVASLPSIPAGTNNIGDVDVASLPAIPAGNNNIGDVDVASLPAGSIAAATAKTADYDTGAGTDTVPMQGIALPASGGAVAGGTQTAPVGTRLGDGTDFFVSAAFADVNASLTTAITKALRVVVDLMHQDATGNATNRSRSARDALGGVAGGAMLGVGTSGYDGTSFRPFLVDTAGHARMVGSVAHDAVDAGNPLKVGGVAVAHGASPTAVAAADRTDLYANRHGVLFVMAGHPNTVTHRVNYTAAQANTAIISVSAGEKIVVTRVTVAADKANSVNVSAVVGFGASSTPTGAGVLLAHPGIDPGGGITHGNGGGILGVGGDGEDLRITSGVPTGGSIDCTVSYFIVPS